MSTPCPFCEFEASDFRESHNWRCYRCGKDYADWLMAQKAKDEKVSKKEPMFSVKEIPPEAEPVQFAQHLLLFSILSLLALNFFVEGIFSWLIPVSIPFVAYYALTVYRTGYAIGQHTIYNRDKNPIMYRAHILGAIGYIILAFWAWVN